MLFVDDGRRWMRAMIWTLAAFFLLECAMMAAVAITARTMDAPENEDCIIVLGGGLDRNTASRCPRSLTGWTAQSGFLTKGMPRR